MQDIQSEPESRKRYPYALRQLRLRLHVASASMKSDQSSMALYASLWVHVAEGHTFIHSGKSATIRQSNHDSGVFKEYYV